MISATQGAGNSSAADWDNRYRVLCLKLMADLVEDKRRLKEADDAGLLNPLFLILTAKNAMRQEVIDALTEIFRLEDEAAALELKP